MTERQEKEFGSHKAPLTYFTIYFDQVAKIPIYGNMRYSSSIENVNLEGFDVVMDGSKLIAREIYGNKRWENMFVKRADLNRVLDRIRKHEIERGTA